MLYQCGRQRWFFPCVCNILTSQEMTEGCWQGVKVTSEAVLDNMVSSDCKALQRTKKEITEVEG